MSSEQNKVVELPVSKVKVEIVPFLTAGVFMDLSKQTNQTKFLIEETIVKFGEETRKEKIYELVRAPVS